MNRTVMSAAALAIVGAAAFAVAQTQTPPGSEGTVPAISASGSAGMRSSAEDRAVLLDARIGAIKAVLKLTPDQEKLWDPVETFLRKRAALHSQRVQEMRERVTQLRDGVGPVFDPIVRMRSEADRMSADATLMREFANAAAPLYTALNDDQKRRVFLLLKRDRGSMRLMGNDGMDDGMASPGMSLGRRGVGPDILGMNWRG